MGKKASNSEVIEHVPINQKLCLSVGEAAAYSGLSETDLRRFAKSPECVFVFSKARRGSKLVIKREGLEQFVRDYQESE